MASGVAIVVSPHLIPYIRNVRLHSSRIMELILNTAGAPTHIFSNYAPHQGNTVDDLRQPFWDKLTQVLHTTPKTHMKILLGDFNVRLEVRMPGEDDIIGPHVFGRGVSALTDPLHPWDPNRSGGANRPHILEMCTEHNLLFANTRKIPNPEKW